MSTANAITSTLSRPVTKPNQGVNGGVPEFILAAVDEASQSTGVSFTYLMNKAATESNFKTDAKAKTSSATGLYQFIDRTWLDMVDRYGEKYGLTKEAEAITRDSSGKMKVTDKATKKDILALRNDPRLSALMAGEYAAENRRYLEGELGRKVGDTDLYLAHFLGAGGAENFLKGLAENPNGKAASYVPAAAGANHNIFYDKSGKARSLQQVYDRFAAKFDNGPDYVAPSTIETVTAELDTEAVTGSVTPVTRSAGAVTPANHPSFFTTMMLASLEAPLTAERENLDNASAAYRKAATGSASSNIWNLIG